MASWKISQYKWLKSLIFLCQGGSKEEALSGRHFEMFPLVLQYSLRKGAARWPTGSYQMGLFLLYARLLLTKLKLCVLLKTKQESLTVPFSFGIVYSLHQSALEIQIRRVRSDMNPQHTYLARRSTMIMKVVPLGWGLSIAHRLGWPLRLPQTWVTRARNFW